MTLGSVLSFNVFFKDERKFINMRTRHLNYHPNENPSLTSWQKEMRQKEKGGFSLVDSSLYGGPPIYPTEHLRSF